MMILRKCRANYEELTSLINKQKYYSHKSEIVHTEIILPPHAPPEYADRNTLWNAAEAIEKQWKYQSCMKSCGK